MSISLILPCEQMALPGLAAVLAKFQETFPAPARSHPQNLANLQARSFDARLGTHKINSLSAVFRRTVYAVLVEGDLRVTFYIEGDIVFTTNIGTHDIYKT